MGSFYWHDMSQLHVEVKQEVQRCMDQQHENLSEEVESCCQGVGKLQTLKCLPT